MKSPYEVCTDVPSLERLDDGTVVRLEGWEAYSVGGVVYIGEDISSCSVPIYGLPDELRNRVEKERALYGLDIYVQIVHVLDVLGVFTGVRYYAPSQGKCTCGAAHTFLPNHHSDWCDSNVYQ